MTTPDPGESRRDPFAGPEWANHPAEIVEPGTVPDVRRRRRVSRRRLRRRRRYGWVMILLGGLIVLLAAWIVVTGLLARRQLQTIRGEVHTLRAQLATGQLSDARATAADIASHASRADAVTSGPVWAVAAWLPGGGPLRTVRAIAAGVDRLGSTALPGLVRATDNLAPDSLRLPNGHVALDRIAAAVPALDNASAQLRRTTADIAAQPVRTWLGSVDAARSSILEQLDSLSSELRSADLAARIAPPMLGQNGLRRYFVAFQNESELRGTGGIPGAFAILRADHGEIYFERFEPDNFLGVTPTGLDFGPGYDSQFAGAQPTSLYVNTNLSPNFPYAAQTWLAMWRKRTGQQLDGAVALDPTVLSYLLRVTGPAVVRGGVRVSADNVVALTENQVYLKFPSFTPKEQNERKRYLLRIARAASNQILHNTSNLTGLLRAAGRAAGERRLLVYSADPRVEADLSLTALSGRIPRTSAPYVGLSIVNVGGNKLDYYLDRSLTWQRTGCGRRRSVIVTVRLANDAPANLRSSYLTNRSDRPRYPTESGDNRVSVSYYATSGATLDSITLDGRPQRPLRVSDLGHPIFVIAPELPRGKSRTIVLRLTEPADDGGPIVLRQPGVRQFVTHVDDQGCG